MPYLSPRGKEEIEYITARVDLIKQTMAFQTSSQLDVIQGTIALRQVILYSETVLLQGVDRFIDKINDQKSEIIDKRK